MPCWADPLLAFPSLCDPFCGRTSRHQRFAFRFVQGHSAAFKAIPFLGCVLRFNTHPSRSVSRLAMLHPRRTSRFRSEPIRRSPAHYAADLCHARAGRCSSALIRSDSYPVSSLPCCSGAAQLQSKPLVALPVLFHSIRCRAGANQFSSDLRYASPLPNRSRHC